MSVLVVALDHVVARADLYPRASYSQERVEEFCRLYEDNTDALPLIRVVFDPASGKYLVVDGVHRLQALLELGLDEISVEVLSVPVGTDLRRFTVLYGIDQTAKAPLSPTPADRKRFCDLVLRNCPEMSDAEVARRCGMTRQGVHARRTRGQPKTPRSPDCAHQLSPPRTTADDAARVFVESLAELWSAKGIRDLFDPRRMGSHLATALVEVHGEDAHARALEYRNWLSGALKVLGVTK